MILEGLLVILNSGIVQNLYGYGLLSFYAIVLEQCVSRKKIYVNALGKLPIWLLFISGLIYSIQCTVLDRNLFISLMTYCIGPTVVFLAGYTITQNSKSDGIKAVERCLCAIAIGCSIHVIFNIFANLNIKMRAETMDYFTGQLAATNLGSLNTYIFALFPCLMITKQKKIKLVGLIMFCLSLVYSFMLGTRSTLLALIWVTITSLLIYLKSHYSKKIRLNTIMKWLMVAISGIIIFKIVYDNNFLNIRTNIEESTLVDRYNGNEVSASDHLRWKYFREGIEYLFVYPMGGNHITYSHFFHNYWLDVGRIAGVLPVILLIILDIILCKHMLTIFANKEIHEEFRYAILGIYLCIFINFAVEPIMDGYMDLFYRFVFINGMVEGVYHLTKKSKDNLTIKNG